MKMKIIAILLLTTGFIQQAWSQYPSYRHFDDKDGLPANAIYDVRQDERGYMWFATEKGMCRYDGYQFRTYTEEDGLPENTIYDILTDSTGRLWFVSAGYLLAYQDGDSVVPFAHNDLLGEYVPENKAIVDVAIDGNNFIYYSIPGKGIYRIDTSGEVMYLPVEEKVYDQHSLNILYPAFDNRLMFLTGMINGLADWFRNKKAVTFFPDGNTFAIELNTWAFARSLAREVAPRTWCIAFGKDLILLKDGKVLWHKVMNGYAINTFLEEDRMWICTMKGVVVLNRKSLQVEHTYFPDHIISAVTRDREGRVWISTAYQGVFYLYSEDIRQLDPHQLGMKFRETISLEKDDKGNLYLGSNDEGIHVLERNGNLRFFGDIPGRKIYDFLFDNGRMYFISEDYCLNYLNSTDWSPGRICLDEERIFYDNNKAVGINKGGTLKSICSNGKYIVLGSSSAIFYMDKQKGDFLRPVSQLVKNTVRSTAVCAIDLDSIYVSSLFGFKLYNGSKELVDLGKKYPLLGKRVNDIERMESGELVIASGSNGLIFYSGDTIRQLTKREGLVSNSLNTIAVKGRDIWVGSDHGVSKVIIHSFKPFRYTIMNIGLHDGLSGIVNDIIISKDTVYVASREGINIIPGSYEKKSLAAPHILVTAVDINDRSIAIRDRYLLEADQRKFRFSFTGLSFGSEGKVRYKYRLSGIDQEWMHSDERQVQYTELSHGDYLFEVYAQNKDGVWSEQPATVSFTIAPPFWKTWWFLMIEAITVAIFIYLIIHWRVNYLRKKLVIAERFEKEKAQLELKALRAQMNPHFTFNTLNSIQSFITSREPEEAERYLAKFARLIRKILDHSQQPMILLSDELQLLELYLELERMRFDERFDYKIKIDERLNQEDTYLPGMLIQPYVENAIVHGLSSKEGRGRIEISIERLKNQLKCVIFDNGIGRAAAAKSPMFPASSHKSVGLSITNKRLELLNKKTADNLSVTFYDLVDDEGKAAGTKVELYIDLSETY